MARGRFITNGITSDKKINDLSDDTSRLAFTWLITFADCEGRTHGDPAMVRSLLFPRRTDVTIERMEAYLAEWQSAGLVRIYTANGDTWLDFPNFARHQTGLRKDHEASSTIAPFEDGVTTELLRSKDVAETPQIKLSISKDQDEDQGKANDPATPVLNELQRLVLVTFNAKRFKNQTQAALVSAWDCYPIDNVRSACTWAATKGFGLGQAIASIDKALPKWGAPKSNGNGNGNGQYAQQSNALAALERMKERHSNE